MKQFTYAILLLAFLLSGCRTDQKSTVVRFATFNTALYRSEAGQLQNDLETGDDEQIKIIAKIIQRKRPDVLALQEFDFDKEGTNLEVLAALLLLWAT